MKIAKIMELKDYFTGSWKAKLLMNGPLLKIRILFYHWLKELLSLTWNIMPKSKLVISLWKLTGSLNAEDEFLY